MRISLQEAASLLKDGEVVAVPTETVYGLAAAFNRPQAIEKIFSLKGRPANNPLITHLAHADQVAAYTSMIPEGFEALVNAFWPGPMTLVLPITEQAVPEKIRSGLPTAAFRIPAHTLTRDLIEITGPLVMPSANISGRPSATSPEHVEIDFGKEFPVLDGGRCERGVESAILIFREGRWQIIRLGALPPEAFERTLGYVPLIDKGSTKVPLCPGQLYRHYAPKAHLQLVKSLPTDAVGVVLGYLERKYPQGMTLIPLGSLQDPEEVAERLYDVLRKLDTDNIAEAWIDVDVPHAGLWQTILERLQKASVGREPGASCLNP